MKELSGLCSGKEDLSSPSPPCFLMVKKKKKVKMAAELEQPSHVMRGEPHVKDGRGTW